MRCMGGLWTTPPVPPVLCLSAFQKIDGRRGGVCRILRRFEKRRHLWGQEMAFLSLGNGTSKDKKRHLFLVFGNVDVAKY